MNKFFKIVMPGGKSYIVVSKTGYAGLVGLCDRVHCDENVYIVPMTVFEFVKYIFNK